MSQLSAMLPPCVLFEDEHLLVVNKPPGWNTHSPAPYAGEGIYEWLRHRNPAWEKLSIIHRLDKETSGVLVFGKTALANKSLTEQFTQRQAHKRYLLLTQGRHSSRKFTVQSKLTRIGDRYASCPSGEFAETRFALATCDLLQGFGMLPAGYGTWPGDIWIAEPLTGRTHQIRVHASENGIPILGDALYGGPRAARLMLHAAELSIQHPATGAPLAFQAPFDFRTDPGTVLRDSLFNPRETDCFRLAHGTNDGWPGCYVDRLGSHILFQSEREPAANDLEKLARLCRTAPGGSVYSKLLNRQVRRVAASDASPRLCAGVEVADAFVVRENGLTFELSFQEGYSVGLFLDQRDNRLRLLTGYVGPSFPRLEMQNLRVLNTFAYTCAFSVAAAQAGAQTTSLDLSKKYLEWGRRNFSLNGLDAGAHDFIYGDVFDWLKRLKRKGRTFDMVVLDPPTFSQSRESGVFRAERDYARLVDLALGVLGPQGTLFASNNTSAWQPTEFVQTVLAAVNRGGRQVLAQHYVPQPPDFPVSKAEPAYLKTFWLRLK